MDPDVAAACAGAPCGLAFEDGWPCDSYTPGPDGRCTTQLPEPKGAKRDRWACGHLAVCHDDPHHRGPTA